MKGDFLRFTSHSNSRKLLTRAKNFKRFKLSSLIIIFITHIIMKSGVEKNAIVRRKIKILEAKMSGTAVFKVKPRKRKILLKYP